MRMILSFWIMMVTAMIGSDDGVLWRMHTQEPVVALTFDDGPDDYITPQLLAILHEKQVTATFFLVGHMMLKFPHIVRMIHADGHHIANHTWAHYRLDGFSPNQISNQLDAVTRLSNQLGVPMQPFMRPPGGRYNNWVLDVAKQQGHTMVMWSINAVDYRFPNGTYKLASDIVNRVVAALKPGSIILMHNSSITVEALPDIIDGILEKSYTIGRIQ